jgi:hypothetical protein
VNVFVGVGVMDGVSVDVLEGKIMPVPVPVTDAVVVGPVAVTVGVPLRSTAPSTVGVIVHNSGNDRNEGVSVGISRVEIGVGGGNGLINEYGLTKILMKMVANASPANITIEAIMSQNDSFIAFHPFNRFELYFSV